MNKILAVARYQGVIDLRSAKTYVLLFMVILISIAYGYLLPKFAPGYFFIYTGGKSAWMDTISSAFTTIATGLTAVLVGAMMTSDVLAEEFETGSISKLFSLPMHRMDIYLGKLVEKLIISLVFAAIFVSISWISAYELSGSQGYISWTPVFVFAIVLIYLSFASFGFLLGSFITRSSFVFGLSFGFWVIFTILYGVIVFKFGANIASYSVPLINSSMLPGAIGQFAVNPLGVIHFSFHVAQSSRDFTITSVALLRSTALFSLLETFVILFIGLFIFVRREI